METINITKKEYERLVEKRTDKKSAKKGRGFEFDKISSFVGLWKNRKDIKDSTAYVRDLRKEEDKRSWQ